eukprot:CAMPEP_0178977182 /NCGR_PEP_ID=MMETSP0789-20121207/24329_1 /TAXON_ID=3005 /ORGANISM="Rhizosolenia setigera, Strain CCMP 1694" /LENGTH=709 /DNA_ID=CAMNT_0020666517 /DNA_START=23 /DNA_END=2152 /DNA_ORIENTATION=+
MTKLEELTPLLSEKVQERNFNKYRIKKNTFNRNQVQDIEFSSPHSKNKDQIPSWKEVFQKSYNFFYPTTLRYKVMALVSLLLVFIGKVLNILPPLAIKYAVDIISSIDRTIEMDDLEKKEKTRKIILSLLAYFGLKFGYTVVSAIQQTTQRTVTFDCVHRFACELYSHLHHLSLSYHLEKHVGETTRVISRGADAISSLSDALLFNLIPTLFETFVVLAVFWKLGAPSIALTTFVTVFFYFLLTFFVTKTRIHHKRRVNEASDAYSKKETESLVNYETVKMFGRTEDEIKRYTELRLNYKNSRIALMLLIQGLIVAQSLIRILGVSTGLILAGWATVHAEPPLSPGSFVVVQIYINQLFQPLTYLAFTYRTLIQAFTDLEKAVTMLKRESEVKDMPGALDWMDVMNKKNMGNPSTPTGEVIFENVSFHYKIKKKVGHPIPIGSALHRSRSYQKSMNRRKGRDASSSPDETKSEDESDIIGGGVDNISFKIPAGKTIALVGKSGSGKTTLIRLILRMYDPDLGSVNIDGENIQNFTQKSLRENIGVVSQETILFNATLRHNITFGRPNATEEEIWEAIELAALTEFVSGLQQGLETLVGERGMKLSGGERQRVGLARCVIKKPKLILLDEATSALDTATEKSIQNNISQICENTTTIVIAHRLSTARHADEIFVLNNGKIHERGTHEKLLQKESRYAKMWRDQITFNETY